MPFGFFRVIYRKLRAKRWRPLWYKEFRICANRSFLCAHRWLQVRHTNGLLAQRNDHIPTPCASQFLVCYNAFERQGDEPVICSPSCAIRAPYALYPVAFFPRPSKGEKQRFFQQGRSPPEEWAAIPLLCLRWISALGFSLPASYSVHCNFTPLGESRRVVAHCGNGVENQFKVYVIAPCRFCRMA